MHTDWMGEHVLEYLRSHYFGKYRGTVVDNDDPTKRGRVKVRAKAVLGEESVWAMPCVPYAGDGVGFYSIPAKDSGVWVEFEGGDVSFPIWTGCFWADNEAPDSAGPSVKIWKTDSHTVRLDDEGDELKIQNSSESTITLATEVKIESGQATHTVGSSGIASSLGAGKLEVTPASVRLNNGSMEVI